MEFLCKEEEEEEEEEEKAEDEILHLSLQTFVHVFEDWDFKWAMIVYGRVYWIFTKMLMWHIFIKG